MTVLKANQKTGYLGNQERKSKGCLSIQFLLRLFWQHNSQKQPSKEQLSKEQRCKEQSSKDQLSKEQLSKEQSAKKQSSEQQPCKEQPSDTTKCDIFVLSQVNEISLTVNDYY